MVENPAFRMDYDRYRRIGIAEAVFCETKTVEQIVAIARDTETSGKPVFFTRLSAEKADLVSSALGNIWDYCPLSRTAMTGEIAERDVGSEKAISLVLGGTSDLPVGLEAQRTLAFHGLASRMLTDVGVAGLHRLLDNIAGVSDALIVIVVAGMEAALPSVIAGLLPATIIAIPTSVGYGVSAGGYAALNGCLASCSPGISVVNIDNGFGAAAAAIRALNAARRFSVLSKGL